MLGFWKTYFSVAWALKTPFVLLLDRRYKLVSANKAREFCENLGITYWEDFSDCDEYAWLFKAEAIRQGLNGAGFVVGWLYIKKHRWLRLLNFKPHCWNVVLTPYGVRQVEPQNSTVFKKLKDYRAFAVII